jgi:hypothetical protein
MTIVAWSAATLGSHAHMADEEKTEHEQEMEKAKQEVQQLEEDPPDKLEDWPEGKAKYETFGGKEGEHSYAEGPESKLGPDSVRFREDGGVEVAGEEVDDPDEFKGEPIPGGPTDPNAQSNPDEQRLASDEEEDDDDEDDTSSDDTSSDDAEAPPPAS